MQCKNINRSARKMNLVAQFYLTLRLTLNDLQRVRLDIFVLLGQLQIFTFWQKRKVFGSFGTKKN